MFCRRSIGRRKSENDGSKKGGKKRRRSRSREPTYAESAGSKSRPLIGLFLSRRHGETVKSKKTFCTLSILAPAGGRTSPQTQTQTDDRPMTTTHEYIALTVHPFHPSRLTCLIPRAPSSKEVRPSLIVICGQSSQRSLLL